MRVRNGSNRSLVVGALLVGIVGLTGCATKRFVGEEVSKSSAASEKRISEVQTQVEAAQSRVREHDSKLAELDNATGAITISDLLPVLPAALNVNDLLIGNLDRNQKGGLNTLRIDGHS